MSRDLDHLKALLDVATPAPDPQVKAAHLKLAQENFATLLGPSARKPGMLRRIRTMRLSAFGGVATVAACVGAFFLVLPTETTGPATLTAPNMVIAESDVLQEPAAISMAETFPAARTMERTEAFSGLANLDDARPAGFLNMIRYDFATPTAILTPAPWSTDAWVLIIAAEAGGVTQFDPGPVDVRALGFANIVQGSGARVFEVRRADTIIGKVSFGDGDQVTLTTADAEVFKGDALLAAAIASFDALQSGNVDLGNWTLSDAINLAAQTIGPDPSGTRADVLDRMRQRAELD